MAEISVKIDGMHCGSCVRRVGAALTAIEGVEVSEVRVGAASFHAPDEAVQPALDAIAKIGFTPHTEA